MIIYLGSHYFYLFKILSTIKLGIASCAIFLLLLGYYLYESNFNLKKIIDFSVVLPIPLGLIALIATYVSKAPEEEKQFGFVWAYFLVLFCMLFVFAVALGTALG